MKMLKEDGTVEFEGTPAECGAYCRKKDEAEDKKNKKVDEVKEKSKFEELFSNPTFID